MEPSVRITSTPPADPYILLDGHWTQGPAAALELSHWPGNRTPPALRRELSTGCALAFAALPAGERQRLSGGATLLVNNHYDTDGVLALFTARHPKAALPRAEALLAAAAAGDFFRWPDDRALALDAIVLGLDRAPESPLAAELAGLASEERWTRCAHYLLETLPVMLDGELAPWRALHEPVLARARADRRALARCTRRDDEARALCVWTAPRGDAQEVGRHALFGATEADRVLHVAPGAGGTRYRLILSTLSWFEPVRDEHPARPDLARLARRLNQLERTDEGEDVAWRHQALDGASPELWFGRAELALFVEHNVAQRASALAAPVVLAELERALAPTP